MCHITHLCIQHAIKELPFIDFVSSVCNYTFGSLKRPSIWVYSQNLVGLIPLRVLKPGLPDSDFLSHLL